MSNEYAKQNRQLAIFKMLANANRLKILRAILTSKNTELNVTEIANQLKLAMPKVSDHLKLLRINKIVKARQAGVEMLYSVREPAVVKFLEQEI